MAESQPTTTARSGQGISLVDNTVPSDSLGQEVTHTISAPTLSSITKRLTRGSVKSELAKRKYAKWQRERLAGSEEASHGRDETRSAVDSLSDNKNGRNGSNALSAAEVDLLNIVPTHTSSPGPDASEESTPTSELDILYENQRGWFFFGIPFYSHASLLQFDTAPWVYRDYSISPVDITNAQVPDPSWEWAWQSWYVDMSADVDEEGWQYSFAFGGKCGWHGTHPWFHSYVRRRRWVRLRVKKKHARGRGAADQTSLQLAHKLNEDYFTIHSGHNVMSKESSLADPNTSFSAHARQIASALPEELPVEDIEDIPTLLQALKDAIIDRQRVELLRKFIAQGGEELYYLAEKVPEILSLFVFQTSRWQFLKLLEETLEEDSQSDQSSTETDDKEVEARRRRRDNLSRAMKAVNTEISGYEVFDVTNEGHVGIAGAEKHRSSDQPSSPSGKRRARSMGEIRGIPKAANIDKEGHIY